MKLLKLAGLLWLGLALAGCIVRTPPPGGLPPPTPSPAELPASSPLRIANLSLINRQGKTITLEVELATTPEAIQTGLMRRTSLPEMRGMLFDFSLYGDSVAIPFYMKNTYIPLSIAFISGEGVILDIQDMEPLSETLHHPAKPYHYALEVNRGWFNRHGVGVGDSIQFR